MQKKTRYFRIFRLLFYFGILLFFALLPYEAAAEGFFRCPSAMAGLQCPGCGVTRAMTLLMHGRFAEAWEMNEVFCAVLFPAFLFVAIQDAVVILTGRKLSFLEYVLKDPG